jgi:hypothetical protein
MPAAPETASTSNQIAQSNPAVAPTLTEAFENVLLSEATFYTAMQGKNLLPGNFLLSDWVNDRISAYKPSFDSTKKHTWTMSSPQFAVVDMDGDGVPEVVYQEGDYYGYLILRYNEGKIIGYDVVYRGLQSLKKDGSCMGSGGSRDIKIGKKCFLGNYLVDIVKARRLGENYDVYGTPIDEETWKQLNAAYDAKPDVDWHECTDNQIQQFLAQEIAAFRAPERPVPTQMQDYLDSLAGLLFQIDDATGKVIELEYSDKMDPKTFYENWDQELDKIYKLCLERQSDAAKNAFMDQQLQWLTKRSQVKMDYFQEKERLKNFDKASGEIHPQSEYVDPEIQPYSIYRSLADLTINRTLRLIALNFGNYFYDWELLV